MERFSGHDLACLRGHRLLFEGLDFSVESGGALVLSGPNGSGKTSLLRLMSGLARPFAGTVRWNGCAIDDDRDGFCGALAWVGHRDAVKPVLTVRENLAFHAGPGPAPAAAEEALERAGLRRLADDPAGRLSVGQSRRLALARLLTTPARLWLLDEPAAGLDPAFAASFAAMVAAHRAGGGMAVMSTNAELGVPDAAVIEMAAP